MSNQREIPVTEAALKLGQSREKTIRLIQRRILSGGRKNGFWYATTQSVKRLIRERNRDRVVAPAVTAAAQ